jgi:hypothetical protein
MTQTTKPGAWRLASWRKAENAVKPLFSERRRAKKLTFSQRVVFPVENHYRHAAT